jgi:hypothetical protein
MTSPPRDGAFEGYMSDEPPPKLRGNRHSFMRGHASTLELSHLEMEGDDGGAMGVEDMSDGHSGACPLTFPITASIPLGHPPAGISRCRLADSVPGTTRVDCATLGDMRRVTSQGVWFSLTGAPAFALLPPSPTFS